MRLFDLHCDTITKLFAIQQNIYDGKTQINLKKAKELERWYQIFAIFIPDTLRGTGALQYFSEVVRFYKDQFRLYSDFFEENSVKRKAFLSVEGGAVLSGKIENIDFLKENDVKLLTLTWNGENELGFGSNENKGLKPFGFQCIEKLEKAGIIIDVSHLSDRGFDDVARTARKPFVATHSNSRKVCNNQRNLTDEQFKYITACGGIVGINFHKPFVTENGDYIAAILKHIEHFLSLGGEKSICIGSDFDGSDIDSSLDSIEKTETLMNALCKANYSEALINDIMFNNALDFFERL